MNKPTRKESQRRTRERLMQTAEELLATEGARVGIEQIARAAGYTRGAFYKNFSDRFELLLDILRTRESSEINFWTMLFEAEGEPDKTLSFVFDQSSEMARARSLVSLELQLEAERNPRFRPHYQDYLATIYASVRELLTAILRRYGKAPPPDLDDKVAGLYAFGLTFGLDALSVSGENWSKIASRFALQQLRAIIASAPTLESNQETQPGRRPKRTTDGDPYATAGE